MIPVTQYNGHAVAVLGLGRSGLAAARALKAGGATPVCWDDNEDSLTAADKEGFLIANLHAEHVWSEHSFAALILSPGIPHLYPEPNPVVQLAWDYNVPVDNDVSLFFQVMDSIYVNNADTGAFSFEELPQTICITGSNGKSTTTALIAHILEQAGRNVQMGGNIGVGVLDLDPPRKKEIYVLELSSYQIELARTLDPVIAVFLNFSPDHYDRHGGGGGYFAAKARLFDVGQPLKAIIGIDEDEGRYLANHQNSDETEVSIISTASKWPAKGRLFAAREDKLYLVHDGREIDAMSLSGFATLTGEHNHQNACAAFAVCDGLGVPTSKIIDGMKSFPGLPHRMETVGQLGTISFVNDSKATNVESAAKALGAYQNIYWIAGGQGKEGGLDGLKEYLPNVKKAYLIGETAPEFANLLGEAPHEIAQTLERAIMLALQDADADEQASVILLAPACASFDQFPSFEHRGDAFRAQVLAMISKDK